MNNPVEFYDIYDYVYVPFWQTGSFRLAIFALFILGITGLIYFWFLHRRKRKAISKQLSPAEQALVELGKLSPQSYETKEELKVFYFTLTIIIKTFLQTELAWQVCEKTDNELIEYLKDRSFDQKSISELEQVLQGSLLIKFANAQTLREQAERDLAAIASLIKKTSFLTARPEGPAKLLAKPGRLEGSPRSGDGETS